MEEMHTSTRRETGSESCDGRDAYINEERDTVREL